MRDRSQLIALAREAINPALVIDADVVEYRLRAPCRGSELVHESSGLSAT